MKTDLEIIREAFERVDALTITRDADILTIKHGDGVAAFVFDANGKLLRVDGEDIKRPVTHAQYCQ